MSSEQVAVPNVYVVQYRQVGGPLLDILVTVPEEIHVSLSFADAWIKRNVDEGYYAVTVNQLFAFKVVRRVLP